MYQVVEFVCGPIFIQDSSPISNYFFLLIFLHTNYFLKISTGSIDCKRSPSLQCTLLSCTGQLEKQFSVFHVAVHLQFQNVRLKRDIRIVYSSCLNSKEQYLEEEKKPRRNFSEVIVSISLALSFSPNPYCASQEFSDIWHG